MASSGITVGRLMQTADGACWASVMGADGWEWAPIPPALFEGLRRVGSVGETLPDVMQRLADCANRLAL